MAYLGKEEGSRPERWVDELQYGICAHGQVRSGQLGWRSCGGEESVSVDAGDVPCTDAGECVVQLLRLRRAIWACVNKMYGAVSLRFTEVVKVVKVVMAVNICNC